MTTQPLKPTQWEMVQHGPLPERLPTPDMTTYNHLLVLGLHTALINHLGHRETTIVICEVAACLRPNPQFENILYPDLLVATNANVAMYGEHSGYIISLQGKPPDLVMEISSPSTYERDEGLKRRTYEEWGVGEYWRYDPHLEPFYRSHLAGDRLVDGRYEPIAIHRTAAGLLRGYSPALGLELHWEAGHLRFFDPATDRYLLTDREREEAYRQEQAAHQAALARAEAAEAELARLRQSLAQGNDSPPS